jgi:ribosomal protein S18 acetylase RimI-like enzyme
MVEAARPASNDDLPRLAELARAAIDELRPTKGGEVWARREARAEPIEASLKADLENSDACVLAGTIDDAVVGYAVAVIEQLSDGSSLARLTDLYAEPEAREVGIGEELLNAVIAWASERHCVGVDSLVLPGNRESKNFFESFGLVARAIVVHRRLS